MIAVLDSSAMIAWLRGEPEGEVVKALFETAEEGEGIEFYAHAVNLSEVFYHVASDQNRVVAEEAIEIIKAVGVKERNDMDGDFWRAIAELITKARSLTTVQGTRGNLALGDAVGVALTNRLVGSAFVTKDRSEIEPLENAGLVSAHFIR